MTQSKRVLVGFTAALLMALVITNASANRLSLSNHNFRIAWRSLEFGEPGGGLPLERCPLTLEGSFHSNTIRKVENALIGHISRASVITASCTGGSATVLQERLPWHLTYQGFHGTLPRITAVRFLVIGLSLKTGETIVGVNFFCLMASTTESPFAGEAAIEAGGNISTFQPDAANGIPVRGAGGGGCPVTSVNFSSPTGDGQVTLLGNTTRIRLTLI